jgi:sarcosine oxidase/L-pipecolate oxidase
VDGRSRLFYGFPTLPWGPPNVVRISVDAATRIITDPSQRQASVFDPQDIKDTQDFVRDHVVGVDATVPASTVSCLQTNVFGKPIYGLYFIRKLKLIDNMFVLDFLPEKYLQGGLEKSIAIFTAGWAMKFVPTLGKALSEMALQGDSKFKKDEFSITRTNKDGPGIIDEDGPSVSESNGTAAARSLVYTESKQAQGSSRTMREKTII